MTTTPELLALRDLCARIDAAGVGDMLTGSICNGGLRTWDWNGCLRSYSVTDTSPEIDALLRERYAAMSGNERALMALQMFETAQMIVLSSLDPSLSEAGRRHELVRRFYGDELADRIFPARGA